MKKNIISILVIILAITSFSSCQDLKTPESPTIVGKWLLVERSVKTNHADIDVILNNMFKQEIEGSVGVSGWNLERDFQSDGSLLILKSKKDGSGTASSRRESYSINKDTLIVSALSNSTRSVYLLSNTILTTNYNVSYTNLISMLSEIGIVDPNRLPEDIAGEYRSKEIRVRSEE